MKFKIKDNSSYEVRESSNSLYKYFDYRNYYNPVFISVREYYPRTTYTWLEFPRTYIVNFL
jgi:hypothetical protein